MNGFNIAEAAHIVNVLPPQSISGGKIGQAFTMGKAEHVTFLVQIGAYGASLPTAILLSQGAATATVGTAMAGATAMPFRWYYTGATGGATIDQLSVGPTSALATGILAAALTKSDNQMIAIEVDAAELADGTPYLQLSVTDGGNTTQMSVIAILSGVRQQYRGGTSVTA